MKRLAEFIVKGRWIFFVVFCVLAILGAVASSFVKQNYDMATYLPEDSDTKQGLAVMKEEFGLTNSISLMLDYGQDESKIDDVCASLGEINGVELVTVSEKKDGKALLIVMLSGDEYSMDTKESITQLKSKLAGYDYVLSGTAVSSANLEQSLKVEIPIIMAIALIIIILVLLMSSHSWFEPVIILINLLVAVLINMGTNIIFGKISYVTFAVSAILQIALAMDYSIILLHGFIERKDKLGRHDALVEALAYNMRPISSSGLTTIAGLIALLFMSFTIGFDIGIVLAKGILVSLLSVIFFMPSLIMIFSKVLDKTEHKPLPLKGGGIAKLSVSLRSVLPALLAVAIVGSYLLQLGNVYTFGGWDSSSGEEEISANFGNVNQAVLLIENDYAENKEAQTEFVQTLTTALTNDDGDPAFRSIEAWTTFEVPPETLMQNLGSGDNLDLSPFINSFFSLEEGDSLKKSDIIELWQQCEGDIFQVEIPLETFSAAFKKITELENFAWLANLKANDIYSMLSKGKDVLTVGDVVNINLKLFAAFPQAKKYIEPLSKALDNIKNNKSMINEGLELIISDMEATDEGMADFDLGSTIETVCFALFGCENFKVYDFGVMMENCDYNIMDMEIEPQMIGNLINKIVGVSVPDFLIKAFISNIISEGKVTVEDALAFIVAQKEEEHYRELYALIGNKAIGTCMLVYSFRDLFGMFKQPIKDVIDGVKANFVGKNFSRIILLMDMPGDSEGTFENLDFIKEKANECFGYADGKVNYVAGMSMTMKDISEAFSSDLKKINTVTVISIFLIIAVLFRSLLLPLILVIVIQGAIWITMAIYALAGISIFFMSYIICLCIQMGATIDYGILIAGNYRRNRETMPKLDAIVAAVNSAMPTIFSSGLILMASGFIIGIISSVMPIYSIGRLLGLGTIISIMLILFLLPALLYLLDKPISWLTFDGIKTVDKQKLSLKQRRFFAKDGSPIVPEDRKVEENKDGGKNDLQ